MGYYSEVSITMFEDDFKGMIRNVFDEKRENVKELLNWADIFRSDDNVITLYWGNIKWRPTLEEIRFIESYIHNGIKYSFKRVGEEMGDVEKEDDDIDGDISDITAIRQYIEIPIASQLDTAKYLDEIEYEYCVCTDNQISVADFNKVLEEAQLHA